MLKRAVVIDLSGEHGSAKSTHADKLIDPNAVMRDALPRDERDLAIAAKNQHCPSFDNVSHLPDWLSDAMARTSTGAGFRTRELYSDDAEALFNGSHPIILNGIESIVLKGDLADRAVKLVLKTIDEDNRKTEEEFWKDFELAYPRILGALLDGVACGLRELPNTRLSNKPRMADFALWATACETAYWKAGTSIKAYDENRQHAVEMVIEADLVATALQTFMDRQTEREWKGTSTELLGELEKVVGAGPIGGSPGRRGSEIPIRSSCVRAYSIASRLLQASAYRCAASVCALMTVLRTISLRLFAIPQSAQISHR